MSSVQFVSNTLKIYQYSLMQINQILLLFVQTKNTNDSPPYSDTLCLLHIQSVRTHYSGHCHFKCRHVRRYFCHRHANFPCRWRLLRLRSRNISTLAIANNFLVCLCLRAQKQAEEFCKQVQILCEDSQSNANCTSAFENIDNYGAFRLLHSELFHRLYIPVVNPASFTWAGLPTESTDEHFPANRKRETKEERLVGYMAINRLSMFIWCDESQNIKYNSEPYIGLCQKRETNEYQSITNVELRHEWSEQTRII